MTPNSYWLREKKNSGWTLRPFSIRVFPLFFLIFKILGELISMFCLLKWLAADTIERAAASYTSILLPNLAVKLNLCVGTWHQLMWRKFPRWIELGKWMARNIPQSCLKIPRKLIALIIALKIKRFNYFKSGNWTSVEIPRSLKKLLEVLVARNEVRMEVRAHYATPIHIPSAASSSTFLGILTFFFSLCRLLRIRIIFPESRVRRFLSPWGARNKCITQFWNECLVLLGDSLSAQDLRGNFQRAYSVSTDWCLQLLW